MDSQSILDGTDKVLKHLGCDGENGESHCDPPAAGSELHGVRHHIANHLRRWMVTSVETKYEQKRVNYSDKREREKKTKGKKGRNERKKRKKKRIGENGTTAATHPPT